MIKITQKMITQGHTNSNNTEDLGDIISMPVVCMSEWMCVIHHNNTQENV